MKLCRPHLLNVLLVRACLGDAAALHAWEDRADIEAHDADMHALLPLLHVAAGKHGWTLRHGARITGVYRYWFARNQMLSHTFMGAAAALESAHYPVIGLDAALWGHDRVALHPIEVPTMLVRPADQRRAVFTLQQAGWVAQGWVAGRRIPYAESLAFHRGEAQLILRWFAVDWRCAPGVDDGLWARAETLERAGGVQVRVLAPAEQFVLSAARIPVVWAERAPSLRLAILLTLTAQPGFSWDEALAAAVHYGLAAHVGALLTLLRDEYNAAIPADVLARLAVRPYAIERMDSTARESGVVSGWRTHLIRWYYAVRGLPPPQWVRRTAGYLARMVAHA